MAIDVLVVPKLYGKFPGSSDDSNDMHAPCAHHIVQYLVYVVYAVQYLTQLGHQNREAAQMMCGC